MGVQDHLLVRFIVIIASLSLLVKAKGHFSTEVSSLKRSSFPKNFLWGAATSAYQEDVQICKNISLNAYRFSISWARVIPRYANHTNLLGSSYATDSQINLTYVKNGVPIGKMPGSAWLYVYPKGIADLLIYIKNKYNSPRIFITETGVDQLDTSEHPLTIEKALNDGVRIQYYRQHLRYVQHAIK
ncbi:Glycosidase [Sarracenia purpurea var. burkii]